MEEFTMMDEELVDKLNQLQAAGVSAVDLPQIVAVGIQGAGKSSVLEKIVGKSFLPRGTDVVTRCPLVLQLVHAPDETGEYAKFQHDSNKIFTDYDLIRNEIEKQTEKLAGANKGICHTSINLKIFSPYLPNLTLVDLPGLTEISEYDQPSDMTQQTRDMIISYIENPNSVILAVTPANVDIETSDSLNTAKKIDPQGTRTLAVITKLDLIDGTDAWDMLHGKVIPVKLGIIGVLNRSEKDTNESKSIKDNEEEEAEFFKKNYEHIAAFHGGPYLAKTVQSIVLRHIKNGMPDLNRKLSQKLETKKKELSHHSKSSDNQTLLLNLIYKFTNIYSSSLKGFLLNIQVGNLLGSSRVTTGYKESFVKDLDNIESLHSLQEDGSLTKMNNSNEINPELFFPVSIFERLAQGQVEQFRKPSLKYVELVHEELLNILQSSLEDENLMLEHYPKLRTALSDVVTELLESCLPITNQTVENYIDTRMSQINISHPDFLLKHAKVERVYKDNNNDPNQTGYLSLKPFHDPKENNRDDNLNYPLMECLKTYMYIERKIVEDHVPKILIQFMVNVAVKQLYNELVEKVFDKENHEDLLIESQEYVKKRNEIKADLEKLDKAKTIINTISIKSNKIIKF